MVAINQGTDSQKILLFNWSRTLLGKQTSDDSSVGLSRGGRGGSACVGEAFLTNIPTFEPPLGF